ncbi:MAG: CDP-glucose 4,6-dehydratase, partial [Blautia sp.]|nr:CDP-glucose 4,6-dehydratase [Blautia sp.]
MQINWDFYRGKRVFITGHTGFKGSWMCQVLKMLGADIYGYSLEEMALTSVYKAAGIAEGITSYLRDIRDRQALEEAMKEAQPEIVIHMAAQPLVRESYRDPAYTYEVNVMGTVNVLEAVRKTKTVRSLVNVTTDKVYKNVEWEWGYRETDELNGIDPYSNSKSCSELVTSSYKEAFFHDREIGISTCRAGNVIGGGDFAKDRIIPDCVRAVSKGEPIIVRN